MFGIGNMMPIPRTFWYSVDGETRYQVPTISSDMDDVAVDAAENYHGHRHGWESRWPLTITLFETEDGPAMAQYEVERESVPMFHARKVPASGCERI